jgi:predicted DNA-binding transcriptional regulator YafY
MRSNKKQSDQTPRQRIVRLLLLIAQSPRQYTKRMLMEKLSCSEDAIKEDFEALRSNGLLLKNDAQYRYYFDSGSAYERLKDLLFFSVEDQSDLRQALALAPLSDQRKTSLLNKLASVYDYRQLGHAFLRDPYLRKIDALESAKAQQKQVILTDYRSSNSNTQADRRVEAFDIDPATDTVQTYDVDKEKVNHFRISRAERVQITDNSWQHTAQHYRRMVDPFRIVADEQVMVRLRLELAACNELVERFPAARQYIEPAQDKGFFDFQCRVNHRFLGLSNFILGFYHQGVRVVEPDSLKSHLKQIVQDMNL